MVGKNPIFFGKKLFFFLGKSPFFWEKVLFLGKIPSLWKKNRFFCEKIRLRRFLEKKSDFFPKIFGMKSNFLRQNPIVLEKQIFWELN
jgi:hypothetical protein